MFASVPSSRCVCPQRRLAIPGDPWLRRWWRGRASGGMCSSVRRAACHHRQALCPDVSSAEGTPESVRASPGAPGGRSQDAPADAEGWTRGRLAGAPVRHLAAPRWALGTQAGGGCAAGCSLSGSLRGPRVWGPRSHHLERDVSRSFGRLSDCCCFPGTWAWRALQGSCPPHPSSQPGTSPFRLHLPTAVGGRGRAFPGPRAVAPFLAKAACALAPGGPQVW